MRFSISNILVGFDNSDSAKKALSKAVDTALRADAQVHAVYVNNSSKKATLDEIQSYIGDLEDKNGIKILLHIRDGEAYSEIVAAEKEIGADLIVMGSHSQGGWRPFWAGKNAYRVVSASNCPVITIQEQTKDNPLETILLPLDDSDTTRQKVPYAGMMAHLFDAKVYVYGVSKNKGAKAMTRVKTYTKQAIAYLAEMGVNCEGMTDFGVNVPEKIKEKAKEIRAGLIVIMTDTESQGLILGSYSQDLVNTATRPIMSIHSRDLKVTGSAGY
jgi:nucleotide-binding universal stress UspA family protein